MRSLLVPKTLALALAIAALVAAVSARRDLTQVAAAPQAATAHPESLALEARLQGVGGGLVDCWNALLELRSCTNEIVLFFLNGESYLGYDCCRAIRTITLHCWPSMLTSLGFTAQEGDILRGYCDAEAAAAPPPFAPLPTTPSGAPAAAPALLRAPGN
ncbi:egg cell-secreted protein 1.2-like [Ananas comosus]|uniref:Egg cell-secreted protein 1.2 n=1 Tax=Ananas comosus TaxID=4615 RepID=A0A199VAZ4_ANACO|nr:egg cell-secreted protein 1.2-like [Ananas comosus]XP_020107625.1 egg cell-secreted protein 1.2-like [Ananas comosus]OAY74051.1 Egg cell-secreted protein 1.2 [Ananas comosus]